MSDQANKYANALNQQAGGVAQAQNYGLRLGRVWVAFRSYGSEGNGVPLAVFPNEALAAIYQAGADASMETNVKIVEVPITWGS